MIQLDYNFKKYYPKWERGNNESPITSLKEDYIEITLYKQNICDKVNDLFETSFKPLESKIVDSDLAYNIKDYLTKKENHFVGMLGSNWHELADEYWGRNR